MSTAVLPGQISIIFLFNTILAFQFQNTFIIWVCGFMIFLQSNKGMVMLVHKGPYWLICLDCSTQEWMTIYWFNTAFSIFKWLKGKPKAYCFPLRLILGKQKESM